MIQSFNNKTEKVGDDFKKNIGKDSRSQVAAGIFTIYGFGCLNTELKKIDKLSFIFTDPTFIEIDKSRREKKQFQIKADFRQKAISGSEFEINLKNELKGKAIAKECKKWIEQKVIFKTNVGNKYIQPHITLENGENKYAYMGINEFSVGGKVKVNLEDMNTSGWKQDLEADILIAKAIFREMEKVTPAHDTKLRDLKAFIKNKIQSPINPGNRKILIFSAFADTVSYLYDNLSVYNKTLNLETAKLTGSDENQTTLKLNNNFNNILINFSPRSKERRDKTAPEIDVLIATDCISEGQNLQDCDTLINYDTHWNPARIIQRFGRIDRIGSVNKDIQLINFWPQLSLDDYINLKSRVESKMFMVDATATGEDNVLTNKSSDLLFRKKQLEKLQEEVVDIEEMVSGVSITDLGLNDFRMDLVNYIKANGSLASVANGMHAVCKKDIERGIEEGVIFVLKNINNEVNIDKTNQLHPFYLVYISAEGKIVSNHLNVKNTLDILRALCKGNSDAIKDVYELFNDETDDGKHMAKYSDLLNKSIESVLHVKDESDVDSLFTSGGTTALMNNIKGLEDFELLTFVVIK